MFARIQDPFSETFQNNRFISKGALSGPDLGPRRSAPAELPYKVQRNHNWYQGSQLRSKKEVKPRLYLIRPHDGKRCGASGRLLDGMTGEGPDVFVSKCGDKRTLMRDRPQRWQWSGWDLKPNQVNDLRRNDKDFRTKDLKDPKDFLIANERTRAYQSKYNFRSRRYESNRRLQRYPAQMLWTDARWMDGARRSDTMPLSYRDGYYDWYSRVPLDAGDYAGGRPRTP